MNIRTTFAKLLLAFDISFPPGEDNVTVGVSFEAKSKEHFTLVPSELNLLFLKRAMNRDEEEE